MSYAIHRTYFFFPGTLYALESGVVRVPGWEERKVIALTTRGRAERVMREIDRGRYVLAHGEYDRPIYKIVGSREPVMALNTALDAVSPCDYS